LIEVTVTQNTYNESWDTRRMTERRQTGKDSKGKPVYQDFPVDVRFKTVKHHCSTAFKVTDTAKRVNLDSDSVQYSFENSFQDGNGAPDQATLENNAIQMVDYRIVHDLTPTRERIGVLLPKGSLENYVNLAESNLWNKYLESLEALPAKSSPEDESYHKYALGVAYEALGYSAEEEDTTLKYLEQAADYYNQAIEANPKEKYFAQAYESFFVKDKKAVAPLERVRAALVSYRKLKENRERYASEQATVAAAAEPASSKGAKSLTSPESGAMNNASVIKMVRAGLSEDIILTSINSAPKHSFDVSPDGLVALSQNQVGPRIIQRIQEIANGKGGTKTKVTKKSSKPH
jgi:tetratricopeptide (TPR) repeat protein